MSYSGAVVAIKKNRDAWVWGVNVRSYLAPTIVEGVVGTPTFYQSNVKEVAMSGTHVLFLYEDGALMARGLNNYGQLGQGSIATIDGWVKIADNIKTMEAESSVTFFVTKEGDLYGCGRNQYNIMGIGPTYNSTPILIDTNVDHVRADSQHMIWLKMDGTVRTMGRNASGQIGNGTSGSSNQTIPYEIPGFNDVVQIGAGNYFSSLLRSNGEFYTWGHNGGGRNGHTTLYKVPTLLMTEVKKAYPAYIKTVVVKTNGDLYVTGSNLNGELGTGDKVGVDTPRKVLEGVKHALVGSSATITLMEDGTLKGVGSNSEGMLGTPGLTESLSFMTLPMDDIVSLTGAKEDLPFIRFLIESEGLLYHFKDGLMQPGEAL